MINKKLFIYTDGASRGNPGPASLGFVFTNKDEEILLRKAKFLGNKTNNQAEYLAVLNAIKEVKKRYKKPITLYSDSNLLVNQLNDEWNVKDSELKKYYKKIKEEIKDLEIEIKHVPRDNKFTEIADSLCNKILDQENH
ncbi:ribonuclease H [archaeon SCG-AAA382B04]|nr:ribonuclease H [archaeon SCG-AAA382B04]